MKELTGWVEYFVYQMVGKGTDGGCKELKGWVEYFVYQMVGKWWVEYFVKELKGWVEYFVY